MKKYKEVLKNVNNSIPVAILAHPSMAFAPNPVWAFPSGPIGAAGWPYLPEAVCCRCLCGVPLGAAGWPYLPEDPKNSVSCSCKHCHGGGPCRNRVSVAGFCAPCVPFYRALLDEAGGDGDEAGGDGDEAGGDGDEAGGDGSDVIEGGDVDNCSGHTPVPVPGCPCPCHCKGKGKGEGEDKGKDDRDWAAMSELELEAMIE